MEILEKLSGRPLDIFSKNGDVNELINFGLTRGVEIDKYGGKLLAAQNFAIQEPDVNLVQLMLRDIDIVDRLEWPYLVRRINQNRLNLCPALTALQIAFFNKHHLKPGWTHVLSAPVTVDDVPSIFTLNLKTANNAQVKVSGHPVDALWLPDNRIICRLA